MITGFSPLRMRDIAGRRGEARILIGAIGNQAADIDLITEGIDGRQPMPGHERSDLLAVNLRRWARGHNHATIYPEWGNGCPLWVKSGHVQCKKPCPLYPRKQASETLRVGESLAVSPKINGQLDGLMPVGVTHRKITCDDKIKGRAKDIVT